MDSPDVKVKVKLDGTDEVKSGLNRLRGEWDLQAKAIAGMISALGATAVIAKTIEFLKEAHQAAQEYRTSTTLLTTQLGYYSDALIKQADILGKKLFIDEGDIVRADQRLLMYTREEKAIRTLIPGIIDLAKIKGIDLATAATNVGIALKRGTESAEGQIVSIKGLGVSYRTTGTEAGNVVKLEEELKKAVGGSAQAVADSLDGWSKFGYWTKQVTDNMGKLLFGVSKAEEAEKHIGKTMQMLKDYNRIQADYNKNTRDSTEERKKANAYYDQMKVALQNEIDLYEKTQEESRKTAEQKAVDAAKADEDAQREAEINKNIDIAMKALADGKMARQEKVYKDRQEGEKNTFLLIEKNKEAEIDSIGKEAQATADSEKKKQKLIKETADINAKIAGWNKKYDDDNETRDQKELSRKKEMAVQMLQGAGELFSAIAGANKRNAQEKKNIARVEAFINTAVGITKAIPNIPLMVMAGVMGIAQQVAIQNAKFAYGGVARGGTPGIDSVPAMLMPGEIVYNPAHPNPALAAMITNNNTESSNTHNYHIGSPQITINGNPTASTVAQVGFVTQRALLSAIREAQNMGKLSASGLTVRG